jgi:hypothetical protein
MDDQLIEVFVPIRQSEQRSVDRLHLLTYYFIKGVRKSQSTAVLASHSLTLHCFYISMRQMISTILSFFFPNI